MNACCGVLCWCCVFGCVLVCLDVCVVVLFVWVVVNAVACGSVRFGLMYSKCVCFVYFFIACLFD